ncbi:hypothetical protein [Kineococcus rhizosphaerae]|uniref:hypothetical protein n=1 Tax=Kineococcus rhizosphaerae TaxID=559628 RepID=UPI000D07FFA9|nr:hypothetical protein [Kineococcus rhizosphaerae]
MRPRPARPARLARLVLGAGVVAALGSLAAAAPAGAAVLPHGWPWFGGSCLPLQVCPPPFPWFV